VTPLDRVRRAQRWLAATVLVTALLWALSLAMAVVIVAVATNFIVPLAPLLRAAVVPAALGAAILGAGVILWWGRRARSLGHVALWVEERQPELRYALVAAVDPRFSVAELSRELVENASGADVEGIVRRSVRRAVGRALVSCAIAGAVLALLGPRDLLRAAATEFARRTGSRAGAPMASRLTPLRAEVLPPRYSRLPDQTLVEPTTVAALIGSGVAFKGNGPASGVTLAVGTDVRPAAEGTVGWSGTLVMPKDPAVVTLRDRQYQRLVVLAPRVDSAPNVMLRLPVHDTTYQTVPRGLLTVEAGATDDIGLAYGYFEYLVSTGSEESFQTAASESPREEFNNARSGMVHATINLDTMKLVPGSVLHIRAVAFDYNDVTGPGKGVSETRTLRIAEKPDSTSITAAPPLPIDSMWISQRLLNMKTDTLIRTERKLAHEEFSHRSSGYSNAQEDIRRRVLAVVALLEDNGVGGSFFTDESKLLRQAADLMWSAREDLGVAQPDSAMPYMKQALKILDDARMAYRYYLRGILRPVVVNIERVRLQGKDSTATAPLLPRAVPPDVRAGLAARIDAAVRLYRLAPEAAMDTLTYVRVAALTAAPVVAGALDTALVALRRGIGVDSALARTRRLLEPRARVIAGPPDWQAGGAER